MNGESSGSESEDNSEFESGSENMTDDFDNDLENQSISCNDSLPVEKDTKKQGKGQCLAFTKCPQCNQIVLKKL